MATIAFVTDATWTGGSIARDKTTHTVLRSCARSRHVCVKMNKSTVQTTPTNPDARSLSVQASCDVAPCCDRCATSRFSNSSFKNCTGLKRLNRPVGSNWEKEDSNFVKNLVTLDHDTHDQRRRSPSHRNTRKKNSITKESVFHHDLQDASTFKRQRWDASKQEIASPHFVSFQCDAGNAWSTTYDRLQSAQCPFSICNGNDTAANCDDQCRRRSVH